MWFYLGMQTTKQAFHLLCNLLPEMNNTWIKSIRTDMKKNRDKFTCTCYSFIDRFIVGFVAFQWEFSLIMKMKFNIMMLTN